MSVLVPNGDSRLADALVVANHAIVFSTVSRWLMHELRSAGQAFSLASELLESNDGVLDEARRRALAACQGRLDDMLRLIRLFDLVLPRAAPAEPAPLIVRDVLDPLVALCRTRRGKVTVDATAALAASLPAVRASEPALAHVLLNLIVNALEAMEGHRTGSVRLAARAVRDGAAVEITVADDGPGVPPALRATLFEPFTTTKAARVAGLGLPVARHLLAPWGGTIRHEPTESGATFVVELAAWRPPTAA